MRTLLISAGLIVLGLAAGCTTPPASAPVSFQQNILWPAPPQESRIAYVQSLREPRDAGVRRSSAGEFFRKIFGAGAEQHLVKPFGVALDEHDNLCLTDTGARTVIFCDRTRKTWRQWRQVGRVRFVLPVGVAKHAGTFYVADSALGQVIAFTESGHLAFVLTNHLERPTGVVISGAQLFVTDSHRHCVVRFDLAGHYQGEFGHRGAGAGEFNFPTHIATDLAGRLYVTDSINNRVQVFDSTGQFLQQIGGAGDAVGFFSRPKGVAVDSTGRVYVLDANFDNFQIFDPTGRMLLNVGGAGAEPGQFWLPNGLAISRQGEIFVSDCYNQRVQVFKYVGPP